MAVTIQTPRFSLYRFDGVEPASCAVDPYECIPVYFLDDDVRFQFFINATGTDLTELQAGIDNPGEPGTARIDFFLTDAETCVIGDIPNIRRPNPELNSTLLELASPTWIPPYEFISTAIVTDDGNAIFNAYPVGKCFKIMAVLTRFVGESQQFTALGCTNCFTKISAKQECFTTKFNYSNYDNAYGWYFGYMRDLVASVTPPQLREFIRLPLYLHSPFNDEQESSYEKSDGSTILLSNRIWKNYQFKTNYWNEEWHESFAMITKQDNIVLSNRYSNINNVEFMRKENIEIDWMEDDTPLFAKAQATGVLRMAAPRAYVNSNCTQPL